MRTKTLGPLGVKALEARGIDPEIAARLEIHTARSDNGEVIPDESGNVIVFPFLENGVTVAEKYRARGPDGSKRFWQRAGGKRTFYNVDALDDPSLRDGSNALVITEGEIDCLSAMTVGFPLSVSVPDGAPPPKDGGPVEKTDLQDDATGKFEFLWTCKDKLKAIKKFIIAVDNDAPGKHLADELVRRLGASRCHFVVYPDGCKDLNDVLVKHGAQAAHDVLAEARPYPLKGIYKLSDYPDAPPIKTYSTGWSTVDDLLLAFCPSFTLVTGIPGSGKSSWMAHLCVNLAEIHGWKAAFFSPEMPTVPQLRDMFRGIVSGRSLDSMSRADIAKADAWINENLVFIDHDVIDDNDADLSLEWLLDRLYDALMRFGIRVFVLDGWNEVEHCRGRGENETEYTNRAVRTLRKFGKRHGIAIYVVAHPTKEVGKDGKSRVPTPYDVSGGAVWYNKPDHIVVVDRPNPDSTYSDIWIRKVRHKGTGRKGKAVLKFDLFSGRYSLLDPGPDYGVMQ